MRCFPVSPRGHAERTSATWHHMLCGGLRLLYLLGMLLTAPTASLATLFAEPRVGKARAGSWEEAEGLEGLQACSLSVAGPAAIRQHNAHKGSSGRA